MKKQVIWLIIAIFAITMLGGCAESSPTPSSLSSAETTAEPAENQDSNSPASDTAGLGDTITTEHFDFSVVKAETAKKLTNALGINYEASEGKDLLFVVFSFKNTTDGIHNTGPAFVSSVDSTSITPLAVAGAIDECMPLVGAVGAGDVFNAYMIWEVPEGWESFKFSYLDAELGTASQTIVLKNSDTTQRAG